MTLELSLENRDVLSRVEQLVLYRHPRSLRMSAIAILNHGFPSFETWPTSFDQVSVPHRLGQEEWVQDKRVALDTDDLLSNGNSCIPMRAARIAQAFWPHTSRPSSGRWAVAIALLATMGHHDGKDHPSTHKDTPHRVRGVATTNMSYQERPFRRRQRTVATKPPCIC